MSCRFARSGDAGTTCELLTRGGWQQLATLEQLRTAGVKAVEESAACPVAARAQWARCPCRRVAQPPAVAPVRL